MRLAKSIFLLFICISFLNVMTTAQKTWEKPFEKWNMDDALKIVTSSPWAQTYQSPEIEAAIAQQQAARDQRNNTANSGGSGATLGSVSRLLGASPVVIRLHSALPVRQAIVRGKQISAGYDKMNKQEKEEMDKSVSVFLNCPACQNYYVVTITQFPDSSSQSVQEGIFQRMTFKELEGNVYLHNDKGEQRELVQFTPPKRAGESAYFFFERKDDKGNLFLTPDNKDFKFVFKNEFLTPANPYAILVPRSFEFKVSKMIIGEKLEF
jgi:hypothetical protein